jgi:hypothetical protein
MASQNVSHRLIGQAMTQIGQRSDEAIISSASILTRHSHHQSFHVRLNGGLPGYCRCLEPSNFLATSLRYQARMVSGLAIAGDLSESQAPPTIVRDGMSKAGCQGDTLSSENTYSKCKGSGA